MTELSASDALGRVLSLRRITMLDRLRLFKAIGAELSMNDAYFGVACLVAAVTAIDGVPILFPTSEAMIEHAVERLGEAGLDAVAAWLERPEVEPSKALAGN